MNIPRKGEQITVLPFGLGIIDKVLPDGKLQVTVDRMLKLPNGTITNQVVVAQHSIWIAEATHG